MATTEAGLSQVVLINLWLFFSKTGLSHTMLNIVRS